MKVRHSKAGLKPALLYMYSVIYFRTQQNLKN